MVLLHDGMFSKNIILLHLNLWGRNSAVGIATGYGLDGSNIKSRWERYFTHQSRPTLGTNQPPVLWVTGLSADKAAGALR